MLDAARVRAVESWLRTRGRYTDTPPDFEESVRYLLKRIPKLLDDMETLITVAFSEQDGGTDGPMPGRWLIIVPMKTPISV